MGGRRSNDRHLTALCECPLMSGERTQRGRPGGERKVPPSIPRGRVRRSPSSLALLITLALLPNVRAGAQSADAENGGAQVTAGVVKDPALVSGFQLLYKLEFDEARSEERRVGKV